MDVLNNFEIREFKYNDNHEIIYENLNMIGKYLDLVIVNNKKSDYTYSISSPKINSDIKELSEKIAPELIKIIKSFGESKEYVQIIAMSLRILSSLVNLNHNLMISIEKDNHFPLISKLLAHPTDYSIKFQALLLLKIAEPHYQKKVVQLLYNQENIQHLRSIFENENYKNDYSKLFFLTLASILDKKNNIQPKGYYLGHFISLYRYNLMYAIYCENLDMKFLICRSLSIISFDTNLLHLLLENDDILELVIELLYHDEEDTSITGKSFKNEILNFFSNVMHSAENSHVNYIFETYGRGLLNYLYSMLLIDSKKVKYGFYETILNALVNIVARGGDFIKLLKDEEQDLYERVAAFITKNKNTFIKDQSSGQSFPVLSSFNSRCLIHIISLQLSQFSTEYICKLIKLDYPKHLSILLSHVPFDDLNPNLAVLLDATLELFRDTLIEFYEPNKDHQYSFLVLFSDFISTLEKIHIDNSDFILSIQNSTKILSIVNNKFQIKY